MVIYVLFIYIGAKQLHTKLVSDVRACDPSPLAPGVLGEHTVFIKLIYFLGFTVQFVSSLSQLA